MHHSSLFHLCILQHVYSPLCASPILSRPENCPNEFYALIQKCLEHQASERPTFVEITAILGAYSNEDFRLEEIEKSDNGGTLREPTANLSPVEEVTDNWTLLVNDNSSDDVNDTQGSEEDWCNDNDIGDHINIGACAAAGRKKNSITIGSSHESLTPPTHASRISLV